MAAQPNMDMMADSNASYWVAFGAFFDIKKRPRADRLSAECEFNDSNAESRQDVRGETKHHDVYMTQPWVRNAHFNFGIYAV